jgi:small subunit ribosomal protein S1
MNEDRDEDRQEEEIENFAEMLESYSESAGVELRVGDHIKGKIISIGRESVFVDTGSKTDGVVERDELMDEEGELPYSVGDELDLYVISQNQDEIRLSKALSGAGDIAMLREAHRSELPIEGKIKAPCKGGFHVEVMKRRAFCPISQIDIRYVDNPKRYVGDTYPFLITRFEENGRNIVVSRRVLLERESEEARKAFMEELSEGIECDGTVTKLMPYGAFVELVPGLEGMIHLSELSWSRIAKPEEVIKPGDKIRVRVIGVKDGDKGKRPRIALSLKQMEQDPWERVDSVCREGDKISGRVTRCADFGAFVEIAPGLEGLVHVSEMSHIKRVLKPEEIVLPGDEITVVVKQIDLERRRISLSIRDAEGDPWKRIDEVFKPGQVVEGTLEKEERYGLFITLAPAITGLLHRSLIEGASHREAFDNLKRGDKVRVVVDSIDTEERRIALKPEDKSGSSEWQSFAQDTDESMGSLGEQLKKAMDDKEK